MEPDDTVKKYRIKHKRCRNCYYLRQERLGCGWYCQVTGKNKTECFRLENSFLSTMPFGFACKYYKPNIGEEFYR